MRLVIPVLFGLLAASPALSAATDWQELAPGTRIRLIASEMRTATGTTLAAIEIDMPAGTKTYWRVPGESGIPAKLDLAGSTGITAHSFRWPYPQIEQKKGYTDFVYYGSVVIPLELTVASDTPTIEANLLLGICSDICVPATAAFSLPLDLSKPDPGQDIRLQQALAEVPIAWTGATNPIGAPAFDAAAGTLRIAVDPAVVDPTSLIVDASKTGHLFGAPQKSPEPGLVILPLLGGNDDGANLDGQSIELIFMTRDGPFEVTRVVAASTAAGS